MFELKMKNWCCILADLEDLLHGLFRIPPIIIISLYLAYIFWEQYHRMQHGEESSTFLFCEGFLEVRPDFVPLP